jgi:hypothetical protein
MVAGSISLESVPKIYFLPEKFLSVIAVSNAIADAWALMKPCFYGN